MKEKTKFYFTKDYVKALNAGHFPQKGFIIDENENIIFGYIAEIRPKNVSKVPTCRKNQ